MLKNVYSVVLFFLVLCIVSFLLTMVSAFSFFPDFSKITGRVIDPTSLSVSLSINGDSQNTIGTIGSTILFHSIVSASPSDAYIGRHGLEWRLNGGSWQVINTWNPKNEVSQQQSLTFPSAGTYEIRAYTSPDAPIFTYSNLITIIIYGTTTQTNSLAILGGACDTTHKCATIDIGSEIIKLSCMDSNGDGIGFCRIPTESLCNSAVSNQCFNGITCLDTNGDGIGRCTAQASLAPCIESQYTFTPWSDCIGSQQTRNAIPPFPTNCLSNAMNNPLFSRSCTSTNEICTDSDAEPEYLNGKNYNKKGIVTSNFKRCQVNSENNVKCPLNTPLVDSCTDNSVFENFCNDNGIADEISYACPNGCLDGACLKTPPSTKETILISSLYGSILTEPNQKYTRGEYLPIGIYFKEYTAEGINYKSKALKKVGYTISLKDKTIYSTTIECIDDFCATNWLADENILIGKTEYTLTVVSEDKNGNQLTTSRNYEIEFKELDKNLCKEVISKHNNAQENRANIVFVSFVNPEPSYDTLLTSYCRTKERPSYLLISSDNENIKFDCTYPGLDFLTLSFTMSYSDLKKSYKSQEYSPNKLAPYLIDLNGENYGLFSVEPFKSNSNKFNFWYIDELGSTKDCSQSGICKDTENLASNCVLPNKYITHITDMNFRSSASWGTSGTIHLSVFALSRNENIARTYTHESGHQIGLLRDEYVEFPNSRWYMDSAGSNCYSGPQHTKEECLANAPWKSMIGNECGKPEVVDCIKDDPNYNLEIGCFESCAHAELDIFRSSFNTIMRNQGINPFSFGAWNEKLINDILQRYAGA